MDEEQQTPPQVELKDKPGTDPEELAYQKKYEKYLKQKERYEYYLKNKTRLDELKNKLETASVNSFSKEYYDKVKLEGAIIKDYGILKLTNIEKTLKNYEYADHWNFFERKGNIGFHLARHFWKDTALKDFYGIKDYQHGLIPKIDSWYLYSVSTGGGLGSEEYVRYYFYGTLSLPKKPILPKKPVKKELQPEIETLETQVQLATLSKSIDAKEFSIGGEAVDKKVYDLYLQYKKDRMIPSDQTGGTRPNPGTPERYQNLSWEYFKAQILNKDEQYMMR